MHRLDSIKDIIKDYSLSARKSLGQNFICDLNITKKIARLANPTSINETIIEIGPGPGGLTRGLLSESNATIIALEKDKRFINALSPLEQVYSDRLKIYQKDALETSLCSLGNGPFKIVANLPYNIATRLLFNWTSEIQIISSMILMFQKEVAQRLIAQPNSKSYGRLSIIMQLIFDIKIEFVLPPRAFVPAPKVDSAIVSFYTKKHIVPTNLWNAVTLITKYAFQHRRKMLYKNLLPIIKDPEDLLISLGIKNNVRAEDLTPQQFLEIAEKSNIGYNK